MTAFRLADMIGAFQFVLDTPKCYGKSPNGQQRTDATGVPPQLTVCQSRPHCLRRFYHARTVTGREYHYSLCGLWRNREPPDILSRYLNAHHLSSLFCLSAGLGVPLHTLMLITITKRKYLANGYSVVKDHSRFRHTKQNRWKEFNPSHLFAHLKAVSYRLKLKFFKKFF